MRLTAFLALSIFALPFGALAQDAAETEAPKPQHAIALHGTPKYAENFDHVDYANPDAPKGGTLKQHMIGTFDSLNPFIVKGEVAAGMNYLRSGLVYESLMQNAWDEPFTLYGVLAKDITVAPDKSWVTFTLRDEAKWSDGKPVTADDVVWTFNTLMSEGQPFFKAYWGDVKEVTANDEKSVTFTFKVKSNAELPLIIAEMTVLPKHYWTADGRKFNATSLKAPIGSGPYKVGKIDAGKSIEFVRDPNWWGKDLPFFKGMNNFDRVVYDYYRDETVAHEAFLSREYDVKMENLAERWQNGYKLPENKAQDLIKAELEHSRPAGMQAFVFNIRRPIFEHKNVREALNYAFDFEWANKRFAYGDYVRTDSYFENSELASSGLPSEEELKILEPFRGHIPDEVFEKEFKLPVTDGSGNNRAQLRKAEELLIDAGYEQFDTDSVRYRTLADGSKERLEFEILHTSATFERWVLPFIKNLERIGVKANFRVLSDSAQFQRRVDSFDFDVIIGGFGQSDSPGNEQREFWGSEKADVHGSRNYIGIKEPAIDQLVTQIIHAESREDLVTKTHALDRILLWNHYVIPMWHYPKWRVAYWNNIERPSTLSGISPLITQSWWSTEADAESEAE